MATPQIVLHVSDYELRLLEGQWPNLTTCAFKERVSGQDLSDELRQMLSSLKVAGRDCVLIIPRRDMVLKQLHLPSDDPKEIQKMLASQIPTIVPFDETQVISKYDIVRTNDSGYSDVVAAIVLNQTAQKYIDGVYGAGLSLADIYISLDASACYVAKTGVFRLHDACYALLISDTRSSEMIVVEKNKVCFSYYLPYGKEDAGNHTQEFISAISESLKDYEKHNPGHNIDKVYCHPFVNTKLTDDVAKKETGWQCESLEVFNSLPESAKKFIKENGLHDGWIPLLGCFMKDEKVGFKSFLSQTMYSSKLKKQYRKWLFYSVGALAGAIVLTAGLLTSIVARHNGYLKTVNDKIANIEPRLKTFETEYNFLNKIASQDSGRDSVVDRIKDVYAVIPDDVSIQRFTMRANGFFELQGIAVVDQSVNQLQSALVASEFFQDVELEYATKRKRFKKDYTEFKMTFKDQR